MKLFNKILSYKYKDYMVSTIVLLFCIGIIYTAKIIENALFNDYFNSSINTSSFTEGENLSNDLTLDYDYYNTFIGLDANDLFIQLESSFWQVSEKNDNYTSYQDEHGNTIIVYHNELEVIESINILEAEQ